MSTSQKPVSSYSSASILNSASQAWLEVRSVAESLSKSPHSPFKRFFPTDFPACHAPINAAITEYLNNNSTLSINTSQFKTGGYVFFPGKSIVGETFTMIIPLYVHGDVQIEGLQLDCSHYYHTLQRCHIEVSEGAKLVALIIDSE